MALDTYDNLVKSITTWSHRKDLGVLIPDFIRLAEVAMFSNDDEVLELRDDERTASAIAVGTPPNESRFVALPDDYVSQRDFKILVQDDLFNLIYRSPTALIVRSGTGTPCRFTVTDQVELDIVPDQDYTLTMKYQSKPLPLSTTNQTNTILTEEPNIYLYGALHQAFVYSEDDNEAVKYLGKFQDAIRGANDKIKKGRYGPAPSMKVLSSTP
jgi:hypothetical protein